MNLGGLLVVENYKWSFYRTTNDLPVYLNPIKRRHVRRRRATIASCPSTTSAKQVFGVKRYVRKTPPPSDLTQDTSLTDYVTQCQSSQRTEDSFQITTRYSTLEGPVSYTCAVSTKTRWRRSLRQMGRRLVLSTEHPWPVSRPWMSWNINGTESHTLHRITPPIPETKVSEPKSRTEWLSFPSLRPSFKWGIRYPRTQSWIRKIKHFYLRQWGNDLSFLPTTPMSRSSYSLWDTVSLTVEGVKSVDEDNDTPDATCRHT